MIKLFFGQESSHVNRIRKNGINLFLSITVFKFVSELKHGYICTIKRNQLIMYLKINMF